MRKFNFWKSIFSLALMGAMLAGCSGGETPEDDDDDSSHADETPGDCNTVPGDAPGVVEQAGTGEPPAMTGGTIPDGTYILSERLDYSGGTCECTVHSTWVISGGGTKIDAAVRTDPEPDTRLSGTVQTSGTTLTLGVTCPMTTSLVFQYSVLTTSGTQLQTWDPSKQQLETYTKQ